MEENLKNLSKNGGFFSSPQSAMSKIAKKLPTIGQKWPKTEEYWNTEGIRKDLAFPPYTEGPSVNGGSDQPRPTAY